MKRICIHWPRFGPYHLARLEATHEYLGRKGIEMVGLETAGHDMTYDWRKEKDPTPYPRVQVFPDRAVENTAPGAVHARISRVLDELDPCAVAITSYSQADARACLTWCKRRKRTAILMYASTEDDKKRVQWKERLKSKIVAQYDAALVSGAPQQRYLRALGFPADAIYTGYGVINNEYFRVNAQKASHERTKYLRQIGIPDEEKFFLASNRFIIRKNLKMLICAYARYRRRCDTPWSLVLLGDGQQRADLERLVNDKKIQGVIFPGFRQIDETPIFYGLAGAFIHPARIEPWGLVVNEAMAAGLPVIVSKSAGCSEDLVVNGENGYTFDPDDVEELSALMVRLSSENADRERMSQKSRHIIDQWSPATFARQLYEALKTGQSRTGRSSRWSGRLILWTLTLSEGAPYILNERLGRS